MRVVFDTDVIVAALRSDRGASRRLVLGAFAGAIEPVVTVSLALEYEAVSLRPAHLSRSGLTAEEVLLFLDAFVALARRVTVHFLRRPRLKDPDDEIVLEAALNGQAEVIVTFNKRHMAAAAADLNVRVLRPAEAVKVMGV